MPRNLKEKIDTKGFEDLTGELVKLAPGERISGEYIGQSMVTGDSGDYPVFAFRDGEGCYKIPGTVQLETAMQTVEPGDIVYIERLADGKSNRGRPYQSYQVRVKRARV